VSVLGRRRTLSQSHPGRGPARKQTGRQGTVTLRADSGFYSRDVIRACRRGGRMGLRCGRRQTLGTATGAEMAGRWGRRGWSAAAGSGRAHDERFNAMVNRIELVKAQDDKIDVIGVPGPEPTDEHGSGTNTPRPAPVGVAGRVARGHLRQDRRQGRLSALVGRLGQGHSRHSSASHNSYHQFARRGQRCRTFFKTAFPRAVAKLGIVYTPGRDCRLHPPLGRRSSPSALRARFDRVTSTCLTRLSLRRESAPALVDGNSVTGQPGAALPGTCFNVVISGPPLG